MIRQFRAWVLPLGLFCGYGVIRMSLIRDSVLPSRQWVYYAAMGCFASGIVCACHFAWRPSECPRCRGTKSVTETITETIE